VRKTSIRKKLKKIKLRKADFVSIIACVLVFGGFVYTIYGQEKDLSRIRENRSEVEQKTASLEEEYNMLKDKEAKNSGDEFYEAKAREEGYLREDEILFVVGN